MLASKVRQQTYSKDSAVFNKEFYLFPYPKTLCSFFTPFFPLWCNMCGHVCGMDMQWVYGVQRLTLSITQCLSFGLPSTLSFERRSLFTDWLAWLASAVPPFPSPLSSPILLTVEFPFKDLLFGQRRKCPAQACETRHAGRYLAEKHLKRAIGNTRDNLSQT